MATRPHFQPGAPDGVAVLRHGVSGGCQHYRVHGALRDPEMRGVASGRVPGAVLDLSGRDVRGGRGGVFDAVHQPAVKDPRHDAGMGPADVSLYAERDDCQFRDPVSAARICDADAVRGADGARAGDVRVVLHVRQLHAAHDSVWFPVARVAAGHVHRRGPAELHDFGHHRPRRPLAWRVRLFRPGRRHGAGGARVGAHDCRLHLESVAVVLLVERRQLSRRLQDVPLPHELVDLCLSQCRLHPRHHQYRQGPAEPGRHVGRLRHVNWAGHPVSVRPLQLCPRHLEEGYPVLRQRRGQLQARKDGKDRSPRRGS